MGALCTGPHLSFLCVMIYDVSLILCFISGNELCAAGVGARVDSVQYAKDITRLRSVVNLLYPNASTRPKVLGPAGFYGKEWFDSFLQNIEPGVVDGVTHHIYNLGGGMYIYIHSPFWAHAIHCLLCLLRNASNALSDTLFMTHSL